MDANAAGIIGLLLGGAGGYYSGKKRADRKASDLEKLIALYRGEDDDTESKSATEILNEYTPYGSQSGDLSGNKSDISTDSFIEDLDTGGLSNNLLSTNDIFSNNVLPLTVLSSYLYPKLTSVLGGGSGIYDKFINQNPETNLLLKKADPTFNEDDIFHQFMQGGAFGGFLNQGGRVGYEQGGIVDLYKRMNHG